MQVVVAYVLLHAGFRFEVAGLPFVGDGGYDQALFSIPAHDALDRGGHQRGESD